MTDQSARSSEKESANQERVGLLAAISNSFSLLFSTQQCSYFIFLCFLTKSLHKTHKMSETEAKTDAAAEQPTAEEIKATKRPAEVGH